MQNKKPIIAVDIDDVIANSIDAVRLAVNKQLGVDLQPEHYQVKGEYWGYPKMIWEKHGLTERIDSDKLELYMREDQSHIKAVAGSLVALKQIAKKFDLIVVTARASEGENATHLWLQSNFPNIFTKVVFGGGHKGIKLKSKGQLCIEHGASWLIDDSVEHAHTAIENGVNIILFGNYGWHLPYDIHPNVVRCKNWVEVGKFLSEVK